MRQSQLFGRTLRDTPSEAELASHRLLLRAGYIRQLMGGSYTLLPLGKRAAARIEAIIRAEMDAIGGQELLMPFVQPAELWRESGRYDTYDVGLLGRLQDRNGRELVLAPTHEEAISDTARRELRSYRQLPLLLYQIQVKFRDEARPRGGLLRVREFTMKDAYSFDADAAGLDRAFQAVRGAYERIFRRCGLDPLIVEASAGAMGGSGTLEFQALADAGEDTLLVCPGCGYAANAEVAIFEKATGERGKAKDQGDGSGEGAAGAVSQPLEEVATPNTATIEQLAALLGVEASATAKAVFFYASGKGLVFAVVRGDHEVNAAKLAALVGAEELRVATAEEIAAVGAVPGYASPLGLQSRPEAPLLVVADDAVAGDASLVAGANRVGYHLRNVAYGRDWRADIVGDIALARVGDPCARCGAALEQRRGIEVGHCFKLNARYSEPMGVAYQDAQGKELPALMGCYGIGVGRLLAAIAERHHDERGLRWPAAVAPFAAHLVRLGADAATAEAADALYAALRAAGADVLYDDRDEPAGVKFNDADLLGMPLRIVVSARSLKSGEAELKRRDADERLSLPLDRVVAHLLGAL
jgi:prolyl-tRNA synthetase